jgi:hypothetical protein
MIWVSLVRHVSLKETNLFSDVTSHTLPTRDGLVQMVPTTVGASERQGKPFCSYCAARSLKTDNKGLTMLNPDAGTGAVDEDMLRLTRGLMRGFQEDQFWKQFVQCAVCKSVVFRRAMFSYHRCSNPDLSVPKLRTRSFRCRSGRLLRMQVKVGSEGPWQTVWPAGGEARRGAHHPVARGGDHSDSDGEGSD